MLYVYAWANTEEMWGRTYSGMELFDVAPETPDHAKEQAWRAILEMEQLNSMDLMEMYHHALKKAGLKEGEVDLEDEFGHAIALEMLGTGSGWSDNYPDHGLKVPDVEWMDFLEEHEMPPGPGDAFDTDLLFRGDRFRITVKYVWDREKWTIAISSLVESPRTDRRAEELYEAIDEVSSRYDEYWDTHEEAQEDVRKGLEQVRRKRWGVLQWDEEWKRVYVE
jgi:hypothetical protein